MTDNEDGGEVGNRRDVNEGVHPRAGRRIIKGDRGAMLWNELQRHER